MNSHLLVPLAVDLFAKSSAIVVIAWLSLQMWRHASAAQRGCIWCVAFALLIVLPFTRLVAPHWLLAWSKASVPVAPALPAEPVESRVTVPHEIVISPAVQTWAMPDGITLAAGIWLAGILLLVAYRLVGAFLLHRCRLSSSPLHEETREALAAFIAADLGVTRQVEMRVSANCRVPVTWGTLRPVIMLPAGALDWPQEWLEPALRHEMGHVKNHDHLKRFVAFLACAFYWPNPLVWFAAKQLQLAQEEASDNLVLRAGHSPQAYAMQLIELIRSTAGRGLLSLPAVAMARPSTLEGRLSAILDDSRNRENAGSRLVTAGTCLALALGLTFGAVQLRAEETPAPPSPAAPTAAKPGVALLLQKIDSIVIDKVDLNKVDINDVMQFLQAKTKELDPDHQGINFVLRLSGHASDSGTPVPVAPNIHCEVTIATENVPLGKLFDEIARQTNLQYSVQDYAVYFRPPVDEADMLTVRTYLVPANFPGIRAQTPGVALSENAKVDVAQQLTMLGMRFPVGATATYLPASGKMVVRNTPQQLDLIADLIDKLSAVHLANADQRPVASALPAPPVLVASAAPNASPASTPAEANLNQKLKSIVLSLDFNNATLEEALNYFAIESKRLDSAHEGVKFIIQPQARTSAKPVTIKLDNVSLSEALGYVCKLAGVKYKVEDSVIAIVAATQNTDSLDRPATVAAPDTESGRAIAAKLQFIVIDKVNFNKLDVAILLQFLAQKSKELDPDKKGINFVLGPITPENSNTSHGPIHREVTVVLDNVPISELLGYVVSQTNLHYSIEDNAVYLRP